MRNKARAALAPAPGGSVAPDNRGKRAADDATVECSIQPPALPWLRLMRSQVWHLERSTHIDGVTDAHAYSPPSDQRICAHCLQASMEAIGAAVTGQTLTLTLTREGE